MRWLIGVIAFMVVVASAALFAKEHNKLRAKDAAWHLPATALVTRQGAPVKWHNHTLVYKHINFLRDRDQILLRVDGVERVLDPRSSLPTADIKRVYSQRELFDYCRAFSVWLSNTDELVLKSVSDDYSTLEWTDRLEL